MCIIKIYSMIKAGPDIMDNIWGYYHNTVPSLSSSFNFTSSSSSFTTLCSMEHTGEHGLHTFSTCGSSNKAEFTEHLTQAQKFLKTVMCAYMSTMLCIQVIATNKGLNIVQPKMDTKRTCTFIQRHRYTLRDACTKCRLYSATSNVTSAGQDVLFNGQWIYARLRFLNLVRNISLHDA